MGTAKDLETWSKKKRDDRFPLLLPGSRDNLLGHDMLDSTSPVTRILQILVTYCVARITLDRHCAEYFQLKRPLWDKAPQEKLIC